MLSEIRHLGWRILAGLERNAKNKHVMKNGYEWDAILRNVRFLLGLTRYSVERQIEITSFKNPIVLAIFTTIFA